MQPLSPNGIGHIGNTKHICCVMMPSLPTFRVSLQQSRETCRVTARCPWGPLHLAGKVTHHQWSISVSTPKAPPDRATSPPARTVWNGYRVKQPKVFFNQGKQNENPKTLPPDDPRTNGDWLRSAACHGAAFNPPLRRRLC